MERDLLVQKRSGATEGFSRSKLARSIVRSAHVLSMNVGDVNGIVDRIEQEVLASRSASPVPTSTIGDAVLAQLAGVGPAADLARIHYAMVFLGRSDRPGALRGAEGFLSWLSENYPALSDGRELPGRPQPQLVLKRDGRRIEQFDEFKLERSLAVALQDRAKPRELQRAVDGVVADVLDTFSEEWVVSSLQIGTEILKHLRQIDGLAYLRFSATFKRLYSPELVALDARSVLAVEFKEQPHQSVPDR